MRIGKFSSGRLVLLVPALIIFMAGAGPLYGYSDPEWDPVIFSGKFFVILEEAGPFDFDSYDEQAALRQLLEESRFVFSAMIYGFSYEYVPYDSARGIEEEFILEPFHTIPWGDSGMKVKAGKYDNGKYSADIRYFLHEEQLPWVISWESNILAEVISIGEGNYYAGFEGKLDSIRNMVKQALRDYLQPRVYNKPRRIKGKARLNSVPYIVTDSGKYYSRGGVTLKIDEVLDYGVY